MSDKFLFREKKVIENNSQSLKRNESFKHPIIL